VEVREKSEGKMATDLQSFEAILAERTNWLERLSSRSSEVR
jgi:hypothetical protein